MQNDILEEFIEFSIQGATRAKMISTASHNIPIAPSSSDRLEVQHHNHVSSQSTQNLTSNVNKF